MQFRRMPQSWI